MVVVGIVLGISRNVVTPPLAQARVAVCRSSLCVSPGSRKWTWSSITPGQQMQAAGGDDFVGRGVDRRVDGGDFAALDQHARADATLWQNDSCVADEGFHVRGSRSKCRRHARLA